MTDRADSYVELRAASAFSFLRSAILPEALAESAKRLGYRCLALADRDGLYGAPRFWAVAKEIGLKPLVGIDLAVRADARTPVSGRLLLLARDRDGYRHLCRLSTLAQTRDPSDIAVDWQELEEQATGLFALTGGGSGLLTRAILAGPSEVAAVTDRLISTFGRRHVLAELQRHGDPRQERANRRTLAVAESLSLRVVATNDVACLDAAQRPLLDVLTCIREKTTLDAAGTRLARNAERRLKSPREMAERFSDLPELLSNTAAVALECDFTLKDLPYHFPNYPTGGGESQIGVLRRWVEQGAAQLYRPITPAVRAQLDHELALIEKLGLAGYFLIVCDIVRFCEAQGILAKGRGSAANSAVCYALNITTVDPVGHQLLFERFLSEERKEWPDIDIDLPSGDEREKVIQYVFGKYGPRRAAMCAEVITYRDRSAAREVGKALGFGPELLDRLSRRIARIGGGDPRSLDQRLKEAAGPVEDSQVLLWAKLCGQIQDLPRHLSQHSGGMIIAAGNLDEVVPIQPARMPNRTIIQWDKDDAEGLGLIKIDLLGLGMLAALQEAQLLVRRHEGQTFDVAHLPPEDPEVYRLCQEPMPDVIGVFQIESRAQIATLPRLEPRCFYDLVVEVALIRPGPIVGKMVHPYLRRRMGKEKVTYLHPLLEPILARTLGFPLFQEQLLRVAMVLAGFSGGDAEALRRAMTHKRSNERMAIFERRFKEGVHRKGLDASQADEAWSWFSGFAEYGFPESHAYSFAYWAYASTYLKAHHPAVFLTCLLNAQPMGFYSSATLVKDAQRHGVAVRAPDVQQSGWLSTLDADGAVQLGFKILAGFGEKAGRQIEDQRRRAPFVSVTDVAERCGSRLRQMEALAEAGALDSFGLTRRQALWEVRAALGSRGPLLSGRSSRQASASPLPEMDTLERTFADYRTQDLTVGPHLVAHHRDRLSKAGVTRAVDVLKLPNRHWTRIGGLVITRQRPTTASGLIFLTLEDETGHSNAVVLAAIFDRYRSLVLDESLLVIEGPLQNVDGVATVQARHLWPFGRAPEVPASHDFR
jgi:error-prone DNA polymerase